MMKIAERVYKLVKQQELITEDTEFHIFYFIIFLILYKTRVVPPSHLKICIDETKLRQ